MTESPERTDEAEDSKRKPACASKGVERVRSESVRRERFMRVKKAKGGYCLFYAIIGPSVLDLGSHILAYFAHQAPMGRSLLEIAEGAYGWGTIPKSELKPHPAFWVLLSHRTI